MKFRSEIEPLKMAGFLKHGAPVVMLGSCFSDEISKKLVNDGFNVVSNPAGPIYSVASLKEFVRSIFATDTSHSVFFHDGLWRTFLAHTKLAFPDKKELECKMSEIKIQLKEAFSCAQCVILTLGSARSFTHKNIPVVNCHKLPSDEFEQVWATPEEVSDDLNSIVQLISSVNSGCKFIVTLSPVRHGGFGLHGNQVSKAILLLGMEKFLKESTDAVYFPSYEILLDDLRDYRFYDDDLKHPSEFAVNYIYEKFADSFFDSHTMLVCKEFNKIAAKLRHRPINIETFDRHQKEISLKKDIESLYTDFPELGKLDFDVLKQKLCIH